MAGEQNIDDLLARLAKVKPLPKTDTPFRTQQAALGSQVRDSASRAFAATPSLQDAITNIQQGGSAQTGWKGAVAGAVGSPIGKALLGGLNVIDTPRRAVVSAVKEMNDYLDVDPNTKASLRDFRSQVSDPSFGFGRVMPMKGWTGRIVGFIGDVALDPSTYVTFGGSVPLEAAGAGRLLEAGASKTLLRQGVSVSGRDGRFALATIAKEMGYSPDVIKRIASHGKSAVPEELARSLGLPRNGLYMFGSRVRLPMTGVIGGALERGLVKTRLAVTNTNIGKKLQYLYTPRGGGVIGDVSKIRADLASGRVEPEKIKLAMASLNGVESGRRVGAAEKQAEFVELRRLLDNEDIRMHDNEIHRFIETGDDTRLSTTQLNAKRAVQGHLERIAQKVEGFMRRIDPSWTLPRVTDEATGELRYVPHVLTDKARRWMEANLDNAWVQRLESYLKTDVMDMKNNFAGRYIRPGTDFLESGRIVQTGSIDEINALFKEVTGQNYDLFETSTRNILAKYVDSVRAAAEVSTLLSDLQSDDFVRLLRTQGEIDPEYLSAMRQIVADRFNDLERLSGKTRAAANSVVDVVQQTFNSRWRGGVRDVLERAVPRIGGEIDVAGRAADEAAAASVRLEQLGNMLSDVTAKQQAEAAALAAHFEEKNMVLGLMNTYIDRNMTEARKLVIKIAEFKRLVDDAASDSVAAQRVVDEVAAAAKNLSDEVARTEELMNFYKVYGDEFGPILQDVFNRIRDAAATSLDDGTEASTQALIEAGRVIPASSDEKLNRLLSTLLKPFDNEVYKTTMDLGEDWVRTTVNAGNATASGRLLQQVVDLGGVGTRAVRATMGRKGGRSLRSGEVRQIIARAFSLADNPEQTADAFFALTMRELRAAFDSHGGGSAGLAAQEALAQELLEGTTSRAKLWREANDAVNKIADARKVVEEVGSRRAQLGGKYSTTANEAIDRLRIELQEARSFTDTNVAKAGQLVSDTFSNLTAVGGREQAIAFLNATESMFNSMGSAKSALMGDETYLAFLSVRNKLVEMLDAGDVAGFKEASKPYYDELMGFAETEFTDVDAIRTKSRQLADLEREYERSLAIDKNANDAASTLTDSVYDAAVKLSNFHILHTARLSVDAAQKITPQGVEIGESLWAVAVAGAAREELQHVHNFERSISHVRGVLEQVRDRVYGAPPRERAATLRAAIQELSGADRDEVYRVVGNLDFIEKGAAATKRIDHWRRNTSAYTQVRDDILDLVDPNWRSQVELARNTAYSRVQRRAGVYRGVEDAVGEIEDISGEAQQAALISQARNRINKMTNSTPKQLREYADNLLKEGKIDDAQHQTFVARIASGEQAANDAMSRAKKAGEYEVVDPVTGEKKVVPFKVRQRDMSRAVAGASRVETETYGNARLFSRAVRTRADGSTLSNQSIDEFFVRMFGDGEIRVGDGVTFKRPTSQKTGEEIGYAESVEAVLKDKKEIRAQRLKGLKVDSDEYWDAQYDYWNDLRGVLDADRAIRRVNQIREKRGFIANMKKKIRAMEDAGDTDMVIGVERRELARLQSQVKAMQKELAELEKDSRNLYSSGVYTNPVQKRYISIADSHMGKITARARNRSEALRALAVDPNAAKELSVATGTNVPAERFVVSDMPLQTIAVRQSDPILNGPFAYREYLTSRVRELDAAVKARAAKLEEISKIKNKVARAAAAKREGFDDAEAILDNPVLLKKVTQAIEGDSEFIAGNAKWLSASQLGATSEAPIPARVSQLLNDVYKARRKIAEIESSVDYTRALQRREEHDFLMALARLDLDRAALKNPPASYDKAVVGALYTHPVVDAYGLDKTTMSTTVMREVDRNSVANDLLQANNKHTVIVDGRVMEPQAVTDFVRQQNNGKFRYVLSTRDETMSAEQGGNQVRYVVFKDKGTGREFAFPAASVNVDPTVGEVVMDMPVYAQYGRNQLITAHYQTMVSGRPMNVYARGKVLQGGLEDFFIPERTFTTYRQSGTGETFAFNMRELGFGARSAVLDPEVVFDANAGRGLTKENFEYIFTKPYSSPGSAEARALRTTLDKEQKKLDDLFAEYSKLRTQAREAKTEKARRTFQSRAAIVQEQMDEQTLVVAKADERLRGGLPANHMGTVKMAFNVLEYFKQPDVRRALGMKVEVASRNRATGEVVEIALDEVPLSEALSAFKQYIKALEYGDLRPDVEAVRSPLVLDSVVKGRQKYLRSAWSGSPEGKVLAEHRGQKMFAGAAAKELDVIKRGGAGEELHSALNAARAELQRIDGDIGIKTQDVQAALATNPTDTIVGAVPDVSAGIAARSVLGNINARLEQEFAQRFGGAPVEDLSLLLHQVDYGRGVVQTFERRQAASAAALEYAKAREAALGKQLEDLRKRQDTLKVQLEGMRDVVDGKTVAINVQRVLPDDFKHLRDELYGSRKYKIEGIQQRIEKTSEEFSKAMKARQDIEAKIVQQRSVVDTGFYANLSKQDAERRLALVRSTIGEVKEMRRKARRPVGSGDDWAVDFDDYVSELDDLTQRIAAMPDGPDTRRLAAVVTGYAEARAEQIRAASLYADAQEMERLVASGRYFSEGDHVIFREIIEDGWVKLTGSGSLSNFKRLQMRPEVDEILRGINRMVDPVFVREMRRFTGRYTQFFKAWALATPGYHVRNSITNAFMMIAAGGRPAFLAEGAAEYNALYRAMREGITADRYIANLPPERAKVVQDAYDAMLGSGVGQIEEVDFSTAGLLTNNPWTRLNRRAGVWVESHTRFMLAYDSVRQGLDVNAATARTRKFLFDYEDISKLDATMRSIVPFWMWTSRILPLTIQNVYMNPRPYQWYASLRRNLEDKEGTKSLPQYLLEAGAFALPGGKAIATPDLGFNRMQADVAQLTDPLRFASNVNPLLRVPIETMLANKQFFRNKPFSESPVEAGNPVAAALSYAGQPLGFGGENTAGQRVVNEKLYYALRNLVPVAAQFERFVPSTTEYQQRGSTNPLLAYIGAPVREFTPEMRNAEMKRRLAEIAKLQRAQPKVEGQ
jgi:hypothetical protein